MSESPMMEVLVEKLLTADDVALLSIVLQHELDALLKAYRNPLSPERHHLTRDAAFSVLRLLRKVSPDAAEGWERNNGHPCDW